MPLSPRRNRLFVIAFVALMLGLSVFAAVAITRGWNNKALQEDVRRNEAAHDAAMPRLGQQGTANSQQEETSRQPATDKP